MVGLLLALEDAHGVRLGLELQVETPQAVLGPGRPGHRGGDGARGGRPLPRTALRHVRLQRRARRRGRVPGLRPSRRRPRQGGHAGRGGRHRGPGRGRVLQPAAGRARGGTRPGGGTRSWSLRAPRSRASIRAGTCTRPSPADPLPGHVRVLPGGAAGGPGTGCPRTWGRGRGVGCWDEPATARALAAVILRGLDCGAVDAAETGLDRDTLEQLR